MLDYGLASYDIFSAIRAYPVMGAPFKPHFGIGIDIARTPRDLKIRESIRPKPLPQLTERMPATADLHAIQPQARMIAEANYQKYQATKQNSHMDRLQPSFRQDQVDQANVRLLTWSATSEISTLKRAGTPPGEYPRLLGRCLGVRTQVKPITPAILPDTMSYDTASVWWQAISRNINMYQKLAYSQRGETQRKDLLEAITKAYDTFPHPEGDWEESDLGTIQFLENIKNVQAQTHEKRTELFLYAARRATRENARYCARKRKEFPEWVKANVVPGMSALHKWTKAANAPVLSQEVEYKGRIHKDPLPVMGIRKLRWEKYWTRNSHEWEDFVQEFDLFRHEALDTAPRQKPTGRDVAERLIETEQQYWLTGSHP